MQSPPPRGASPISPPSSADSPLPPPSPTLDPAVVGTIYCLIGAIVYTAANMCLRALADGPCQYWVICVKESVAVLAMAPWLLYQTARGRPVWPTGRTLVTLSLVGLATQVIGNVGVQWAMRQIGLSVTIPAVMGVNLVFSALFGMIFLREAVRLRTWAAIAILILAIVLLRLGLDGSEPQFASGSWKLGAAMIVSCMAGMIFAGLAVTIRQALRGPLPLATVVFWIPAMGVVSLAPLSCRHLGISGLMATPPSDLGLMLLAGVFNVVAFFAIVKGLQLAPVVRVNLASSSQVAMAAVAGMLLFHEKLTAAVLLGIGLTMVGVVLVGQPQRKARELKIPEGESL